MNILPGVQARYSGGGITVAQLLVTDMLGKPLPALMRALVLDPLGMVDMPTPGAPSDAFRTVEVDAEVVFNKAEGVVKGLTLTQDGKGTTAERKRHRRLTEGTTMHSNHRRELLAGGTAFVAGCFCHGTFARATEAPRSFDMIAYCCLDCAKCSAYQATIKDDDALRAEVAAAWKMKPEQVNCLGCKSTKPLFNCSLKKCATKRSLKTCAHCADFPTCKDEQWSKYPKLREAAEAMRTTLAG